MSWGKKVDLITRCIYLRLFLSFLSCMLGGCTLPHSQITNNPLAFRSATVQLEVGSDGVAPSEWGVFPLETKLILRLVGGNNESKTITLSLRKNLDLLSSHYSHEAVAKAKLPGLWLGNKSKLVERDGHHNHCFYRGQAVGRKGSSAAVSLCHGVEGVVQVESDLHFYISPLRRGDGGRLQHARSQWKRNLLVQHSIIPVKEPHWDANVQRSGLEHLPNGGLAPTPVLRRMERARRLVDIVLPEENTASRIRIYVANDNARFKSFGAIGLDASLQLLAVEQDTLAVVNYMGELLKTLRTTPGGEAALLGVQLVGQETWVTGNLIPYRSLTSSGSRLARGSSASGDEASEVDPASLLDAWNRYRVTSVLPNHPHDHGQLFSGEQFAGDVVGLSVVGTMCIASESGAVLHAPKLDQGSLLNAAAAAHELGHSLGARHDGDGNTCSERGFLMSSSLGPGSQPDSFEGAEGGDWGWSPCAEASIQALLPELRSTCLAPHPASLAAPGPKSGSGSGSCGDGQVGPGEQCDCGRKDCRPVDSCCDGNTCQLLPGAQCSPLDPATPCCSASCTLVAPGARKLCRKPSSQCGSAAFCDGARSNNRIWLQPLAGTAA